MSAVVYDPYDYAVHEDPYPFYARLRDEAPVYEHPEGGFWALSRHADVSAGLKDVRRLSNRDGVSLDPAASGAIARTTMSFLAMDAPEHRRLRNLVSRAFTFRRVAALEPRIREITLGHLLPALDEGAFDFIERVAGTVPMDVISELLGVPVADRAELRRLADLVVHRDEGVRDVPLAAAEAAITLIQYYDGMIREREANPTDDLTSGLIEANVDGERLTGRDIIAVVFLLVVAGNETTTKLLGSCWYWAGRNPEQKAKAFAGGAAVERWVEETLRYDGSTQMLARTALEDIPLHGRTIPNGARVLLLLGAANRDPRVFPEPDRYDLDRDNRELVSFGAGQHFCLGAPLARMEARVVLEELVARIADYDIDLSGVRRTHSINVRGLSALPTKVVPR
ncbi:MAG TPA: cytochrome P450 [Mycobacteriales bacterium]|nr:cytochrome P450 [Mycobacteriales bacterium]